MLCGVSTVYLNINPYHFKCQLGPQLFSTEACEHEGSDLQLVPQSHARTGKFLLSITIIAMRRYAMTYLDGAPLTAIYSICP